MSGTHRKIAEPREDEIEVAAAVLARFFAEEGFPPCRALGIGAALDHCAMLICSIRKD